MWRNQSLYEVQFFHRGFNFDRRVGISEIVDGTARTVPYNPTWFDFGRVVRQPGKLPRDLGYAGFRIHYPLHTPGYKDELIVFLGASFFRVLGRNQDYGLTARGLAINTAAKGGEEFPWFTDFWLVRPTDPEQRTLTLYALLDSDSITGAYQFVVRRVASRRLRSPVPCTRAGPSRSSASRPSPRCSCTAPILPATVSMTIDRRCTIAMASWHKPAPASGCGDH